MFMIMGEWIIQVLIILLAISFLMYKYLIRNYNYFEERNIYYAKPIPLFGSILPVITKKSTVAEWLRGLYNSIDAPYFGIFVFDKPCLIIRSPELVKNILIKDFNQFCDRTVLAPKHDEIISNMLFIQKNPNWKNLRSKMSPVFSSSKLKGMFASINEIGMELNQYVKKNVGKLESKEICVKFATYVIAKCAFAMKGRSFEDENPEFRHVGRVFFGFTWRSGIAQISYFFLQNWASALRLDAFEKWAIQYLRNIFSDQIKTREENKIKGFDFIDILVEMRKSKEFCNDCNENVVIAQAIQFFLAGFETVSSTISFTLYELCLQSEIQEKLRKEIIINIKKYNGITYEGLQEIKYMEMCIYETLRKYPVLPFLDRTCNANYIVDGRDIIEKGMSVYIPLMALHYDETYFLEPEKYDPERFADKNSHNVNGLYYIPFGEGPRICIGQRFGMLTVKIGLAHILSEFVLERTLETPVPIKFETKSLLLQSDVGLPIKYKEYLPE